jgi:hypothetical protein
MARLVPPAKAPSTGARTDVTKQPRTYALLVARSGEFAYTLRPRQKHARC